MHLPGDSPGLTVSSTQRWSGHYLITLVTLTVDPEQACPLKDFSHLHADARLRLTSVLQLRVRPPIINVRALTSSVLVEPASVTSAKRRPVGVAQADLLHVQKQHLWICPCGGPGIESAICAVYYI